MNDELENTQGEEAPISEEIPSDYKCNCEKPVIPMEEWMKGHENDEELGVADCRPCALGPVLGWYRDELQANGKEGEAAQVVQAAEESDPLTVCKLLDNIKANVGEPLRERLKDFDCAAQSFKEQDALNEDA